MARKSQPLARAPRDKPLLDNETPANGMRLWAPWRYQYIKNAGAKSDSCIFCFGKLAAAERKRRLILHAGRDAIVMLNRYPYNNGHLMVAPRRHVASPELHHARGTRHHRGTGFRMLRAIAQGAQPLGPQCRRESRPQRGRGNRGPYALAHRAAMGRRHQLHARASLNARVVAGSGIELPDAGAAFQNDRCSTNLEKGTCRNIA
jgi:hypothetical protein